MIRLLCVHGIKTPASERRKFAKRWQETLWGAGLETRCHGISWPSTGSTAGDLLKWTTSARYRRQCAEAVRSGLSAVANTHWQTTPVVVAHSGGCVLALVALGMMGNSLAGRMPLVMLGNPHHHPVFGPVLGKLFRPPHNFWQRSFGNRDDGVCSLFGQMRDVDRLVIVNSYSSWLKEHPARNYLDAPEVVDTIRIAYHDNQRDR